MVTGMLLMLCVVFLGPMATVLIKVLIFTSVIKRVNKNMYVALL